MMLRPSLFLIVTILSPFQLHAQIESNKKGWGGNPEMANKLKAHWYYDWWTNGKSSPGLEFVPMVKGKGQVNDNVLNDIKASGAKVILCLNEPERASQGDTTVEEALKLWPTLMKTGLRLSSPAPSSDGPGMAWLDSFMQGVKKRKLRVDFIAIHWYRSSNPKQFEDFLAELHHKYHRPIWVTEFNSQYSKGDRDHFASQAFKICEKLKFVERYCYFSTNAGQSGSLFKEGGHSELTSLGEDYARH